MTINDAICRMTPVTSASNLCRITIAAALTVCALFLATLLVTPFASAAVPAFPGAQGGGAVSVGGRGGSVIEVTTLADAVPAPEGSFRAAVEAFGARTVVFRVGGTINLARGLTITNPFLTIAGQTAPGGGILLKGKTMAIPDSVVRILTNDVIIRYIRIAKGFNSGCTGECGANIVLGSGSYNVMIDHVTAIWNQDEGIGAWNGLAGGILRNVTISWCLVAEGLHPHSTGYITGGNSQALSNVITDYDLHHNLTMNDSHRNPLLKNKSSRVVNNLCYNQRFYTFQGGGGLQADLIGNKFKKGPLYGTGPIPNFHEIQAFSGNGSTAPGTPLIYLSGNVGWNQTNPAADQWVMTAQVDGENGNNETLPIGTAWRRGTPLANLLYPITAEPVATLDAPNGLMMLTVGASRRLDLNGNWVANRDSVATRLINQYQTDTGNNFIPTDESQVGIGGFPVIAGGTPYVDSDNDGMADQWEINNFGSITAKNNNSVAANGFTELENFLAGPQGAPPPVPAAPTNLAATTVSSSQINLTWTDNASNETGFEVDRALNSAFTSGLVVNAYTSGANPAMPVAASGLSPSTNYFFRARATNASGDSANSNTASATTQGTSTVFSTVDPVLGDAANWTPAGGTWSVVTDAGNPVYQQSNSVAGALSSAGTIASNYSVEAKIKPLTFNTGNDAFVRIMGRFVDANNYYYILFGKDGPTANVVRIKKIVGGAVTQLTSNPFTVTTGTWYTLKLAMSGTSLTAFVNGNQIATVTDASLSSGKIALGTLNGTANFDDVLITLSDTTPPTVSMTAPASGATVSGSSVAVSASASDNVGVVGVQFKLDGANLGAEDTSSPYSITWNTTTATNGSRTLTAVARDAAGNTTTSAGRTVTVNNPTLPDVIVTVLNYSGGVFTCTVKNQGNAATPAGVAIGVAFFVDGIYRTWGGSGVPPIAAGASVNITSTGSGGSYNIPTSPPANTVLAHVDDVNRFAESNETNNTLSITVP